MSFNPDEYLSTKRKAGAAPGGAPPAFDPDSYLASVRARPAGGPPPAAASDAPAAPQAEKPGMVESALRGLKQGVTLDFGDEITGAVESLFTDKTYEQARDEARANDKAAREANPWTYGAGNLGGSVATSLVPGLGIAKGAGVLGIGGLGASEKKDLAGQLTDAVTSAVIGGATAGVVSKLVGGAPKRVTERLVGDIVDGSPATIRDKVVGKISKVTGEAEKLDDVLKAVRADKAFMKASQDTPKALARAATVTDEAGEALAKSYEVLDDSVLGVRSKDIIDKIRGVKAGMAKNPATKPLRDQLDNIIEQAKVDFGAGARDRVPLAQVRRFVTDMQKQGFAGNIFDPGVTKQLRRDVAGAVKSALDERLDEIVQLSAEVAKKKNLVNLSPAMKKLSEVGEVARGIDALNKKYSTWRSVTESLERKATRELTPSTRLKNIANNTLDIGLAFSNFPTLVAKKSAEWVGKPLARAADERLAELATAAARGDTPAIIAKRAIELGFAAPTAQFLGSWMIDKFGPVSGDDAPVEVSAQ
jgi:hypothetical protein